MHTTIQLLREELQRSSLTLSKIQACMSYQKNCTQCSYAQFEKCLVEKANLENRIKNIQRVL